MLVRDVYTTTSTHPLNSAAKKRPRLQRNDLHTTLNSNNRDSHNRDSTVLRQANHHHTAFPYYFKQTTWGEWKESWYEMTFTGTNTEDVNTYRNTDDNSCRQTTSGSEVPRSISRNYHTNKTLQRLHLTSTLVTILINPFISVTNIECHKYVTALSTHKKLNDQNEYTSSI